MQRNTINRGIGYCGELVRAHDPDRFLLSMFAPAGCRHALWTLFAFNHEIAKTREVVTETQLGLIRLQWWRESIAEIYDGGKCQDHEILNALKQAIQRYDLSREYFETLLYAREFDLEDVLPSNIDGLLNYADFTQTPLLRLCLECIDQNPEKEPVRSVAINYALSGLIRSVPFHAAQGRCYLPENLMQAHQVKLSQLLSAPPPGGLREIIKEVHSYAQSELNLESRFLCATHKLALIYLRQIAACDFDPYNRKMFYPPPLKTLKLVLSAVL